MRKIQDFFASLFGTNKGAEEQNQHPRQSVNRLVNYAPRYERINSLFPRPVPPYVVEARLYALIGHSIWDWDCFRAVLICLATLGEGRYIPASYRPDCVFLNGLQPTVSDLRHISGQSQGRETSRVVFVDKERSCLVISGKTHIGTITTVKIIVEPELNRNMVQLPVLSIHVHPDIGDTNGLSDVDYVSFLSDPRQIVMLICYQGGIMFAMKTSATPKAVDPKSAQHMVSITRNDILKVWSNLRLPKSILAFNKAIYAEFGMTLYQTSDADINVARRIEVTQ